MNKNMQQNRPEYIREYNENTIIINKREYVYRIRRSSNKMFNPEQDTFYLEIYERVIIPVLFFWTRKKRIHLDDFHLCNDYMNSNHRIIYDKNRETILYSIEGLHSYAELCISAYLKDKTFFNNIERVMFGK